jgi:hypothetical protein
VARCTFCPLVMELITKRQFINKYRVGRCTAFAQARRRPGTEGAPHVLPHTYGYAQYSRARGWLDHRSITSTAVYTVAPNRFKAHVLHQVRHGRRGRAAEVVKARAVSVSRRRSFAVSLRKTQHEGAVVRCAGRSQRVSGISEVWRQRGRSRPAVRHHGLPGALQTFCVASLHGSPTERSGAVAGFHRALLLRGDAIGASTFILTERLGRVAPGDDKGLVVVNPYNC